MLGAGFVEDGIGVADVEEDLAADGVGRELGEQTVGAREWEVAELASGFVGAPGGVEFVVGPEGAVDENGFGTRGELGPFAGATGQAWSDERLFVVLFEEESGGRLIGGGGLKKIITDVVRVGAAERDRGVEERGGVTRIVRKVAADASSRGKGLPLNRRFGALQDLEDAVLGLEDALHRRRGKDEETLRPTQVEKAESGVNFRRGKKNAGNRRAAGAFRGGEELGPGQKLGAEIGRSADEEPKIGKRRDGDLGLRARAAVQRAVAEAGAVTADAIPLGESTVAGRAKNFDVHFLASFLAGELG